VDTNNRGSLTRDELRMLLSLLALAQQGRPLSLDQLHMSNGAWRLLAYAQDAPSDTTARGAV